MRSNIYKYPHAIALTNDNPCLIVLIALNNLVKVHAQVI